MHSDLAPVAELRTVTKCFDKTRALDGVNLALKPGQLTALLGPNGAGKTTAVRLMLGTCRPTAGEVRLFGRQPGDREARRRVGAMLQIGRVPETLTAREHLTLFASYYGTPLSMDRLFDLSGIREVADRRFGQLSGGQKQRVLFAAALCGDPQLLFLDEPTVGLDIEARHLFWNAIRDLIAAGRSVLLTTHYLEEADALADRVVVLQRGRIVADGSPASVKQRVAGRRVRCITGVGADVIRAWPSVQSVTTDGSALVMLSSSAETLVRELLMLDPGLTELEVSGIGLEEAFVALTTQPGEGIVNDLRIYALEAWTELLKVVRLPAYALPTIGFPAMFYVLFALALGGQQVDGAGVGTYMLGTYGAFGVMGASLFGFGVSLAIERAQGWLLLKRSMPAPAGSWIVGKMAVSLAFSLAVVLVLALLGIVFGGVRMPIGRWGLLFTVLVAGALPFSALGLALGYLCGPNSAPAVVNLIYLPMAFLSGLWVPVAMLPVVMQKLALSLPAYHFAQLALIVVGGGRGGPAWSHLLVLAGFTLLSVAVALWAYRRDEGVTFG